MKRTRTRSRTRNRDKLTQLIAKMKRQGLQEWHVSVASNNLDEEQLAKVILEVFEEEQQGNWEPITSL